MTKRRAIILGVSGIAGLAAWQCRIPQVASFMVAAGLRKLLTPDVKPDFRTLAPQWAVLRPTHAHSFSQSRGMITYHPWYHHFRPSIANECLAEAAALGAGYMRIDIRWEDLIPDGRNVDESAWTWYERYLHAAHDWYGLRPLIVLSNAPRAVLGFDVDLRLAAWSQYVDEVASRVGNLCTTYQPLNEPNNPVFRIFPTKATAKAIVIAAQAIRQHNPGAHITINILAGLLGWLSDLKQILQESAWAVDIVGLDYYPGTWTVSFRSDMANWNLLAEVIARERESGASPLNGRPLAIIETGYSTNSRWCRSEHRQVSYFRTLEYALKRLDARFGADGLRLVGIHELSDSDSGAFLDPEAHFGLLTDTLNRKPAFDEVRQIFRMFG